MAILNKQTNKQTNKQGQLQNGQQAKARLARALVTISDLESEYATKDKNGDFAAAAAAAAATADDAEAAKEAKAKAGADAESAAAELSGKRAEVLAAMGQVRGRLDGDYEAARVHLQKALVHALKSGSSRIEVGS